MTEEKRTGGIVPIFRFANMHKKNEKLSELASLAMEPWGVKEDTILNIPKDVDKAFGILLNYISNSYAYLETKEPEKIVKNKEKKRACFNTGLLSDDSGEEIYA